MNIKLSGITPLDKVPSSIKNMTNSQFDNKEILKLSDKPFGISKIMSMDIKVSILNCNIKKTDGKCTLSITGNKKVTVSYISDESFDGLHELKYDTPFTTYIDYQIDNIKFKNIYVAVESADIDLVDKRTIKLETRLLVAPLIF